MSRVSREQLYGPYGIVGYRTPTEQARLTSDIVSTFLFFTTELSVQDMQSSGASAEDLVSIPRLWALFVQSWDSTRTSERPTKGSFSQGLREHYRTQLRQHVLLSDDNSMALASDEALLEKAIEKAFPRSQTWFSCGPQGSGGRGNFRFGTLTDFRYLRQRRLSRAEMGMRTEASYLELELYGCLAPTRLSPPTAATSPGPRPARHKRPLSSADEEDTDASDHEDSEIRKPRKRAQQASHTIAQAADREGN